MKTLFLLLLSIFTLNLYSQSGLSFFGYVQSSFTNYNAKFIPTLDDYTPPVKVNFMGINQLNLMAFNQIEDNFTAFLNLEFTNNYSSSKGFGYFNLQEAFLRWDYSNSVKFKFGMLIPKFNSFYEIYNRFPLFPYIARPKMYETNLENVVNLFDFLPQKALVQVYGFFPINSFGVEYSLFFGNPPDNLISSKDNDLLPGYIAYGQSSSSFLSFGGRLGFKSPNFSLGASAQTDRDNRQNFVVYDAFSTPVSPNPIPVNFGEHARYRLGADLELKFGDFSLSGEVILSKTNIPSSIQDSLKKWSKINPNFNGDSFDKIGYFLTLMYTLNDKYFAFFMMDYLNDDANRFYFGIKGSKGYNFGLGSYISEKITLKSQVVINRGEYDLGLPVNPVRKYEEEQYQIGLSYTF